MPRSKSSSAPALTPPPCGRRRPCPGDDGRNLLGVADIADDGLDARVVQQARVGRGPVEQDDPLDRLLPAGGVRQRIHLQQPEREPPADKAGAAGYHDAHEPCTLLGNGGKIAAATGLSRRCYGSRDRPPASSASR